MSHQVGVGSAAALLMLEKCQLQDEVIRVLARQFRVKRISRTAWSMTRIASRHTLLANALGRNLPPTFNSRSRSKCLSCRVAWQVCVVLRESQHLFVVQPRGHWLHDPAKALSTTVCQ